ncbi:MAG: Gfo/Idh/MocA family oxidoreductase [Candidatus Margulisbacteria bacterium]|jgi:predicted dehydrogenase|nr:Gfo/Idh/MocA family oxidoreductase [Candidatus Margulisiibacteriota bacterium]
MRRGKGVRFGVIGVGSMGKNHARVLADLPGVRLAGVADTSRELAEASGQHLDVPWFDDYHNLLPEIDAAVVVTPTSTHFEIAQTCLQAGKHLLVEKPLTGVSSLARSLVSLAADKNLVLAVGMVERFNPAFPKLLKAIKGEKIIGIDIKRLSPFPDRITDTDVVFDMMIHDLDLFIHLFPDEVVDLKVKGEKIRTKKLDRVVATLTHKNGAISRIEASRVFGSRTRNITVTTDRSLYDADLLNKKIYIRDFTSPTPTTLPLKPVDQLTLEHKDFLAAIKTGRAPLVSGTDFIRVLEMTEEVERLAA